MPTVFSHPAPALALAAGLGSGIIPWRLAAAGVFCSIAPDLDVVGFKLGISYGAVIGHRGASHSLLLALALGFMCAFVAPWLRSGRGTAFFVGFGAAATHILLDAMTSGGMGVAAFWPLSETRYFLPWRPITVSPISPRAFFTGRGAAVMLSELRWIWLPCAGVAAVLAAGRMLARLRSRGKRDGDRAGSLA